MKRAVFLLLALLLGSTVFITDSAAQVRGRALYDSLASQQRGFFFRGASVSWLPDGTGYYRANRDNSDVSWIRVDADTGKESALFSETTMSSIRSGLGISVDDTSPLGRFSFVQDGQGLFFSHDGTDYLYEMDSRQLRELKHPSLPPRPPSTSNIGTTHMRASQIWTGTYSPDYSHFGFTRDFDLYVADTKTGEETRLTTGGSGTLMNGRPDWVYPEEAGQDIGFVWSPDGSKIAYLQWDESDVYQYPLVHSLEPEADLELEHYPKPGKPNPTVNLFVVDLATGAQVQIETSSSPNNYILRPIWRLDGSELTFQRLNRHQNRLELLAANPSTGAVRTVLVEEEEAFVNLQDDYTLLSDGDRFIWTSERTGWRHIYLYNFDGELLQTLTGGEWPVGSVSLVDENHGWVYFSGFTNGGLDTQFFRAGLDGSGYQQITTVEGSHRASIDPTGRYFVDSWSSFTSPQGSNLYRTDGTLVRNLTMGSTEVVERFGLEPVEHVVVKAADGITDLDGLLFKPAGYNPDMSYPMIVTVYGGPYSKAVTNRYWDDGPEQRLAQLGFMVWKVDNRGEKRRGKKFETETYLKLGQVDLADQAAAVRQITQRPYIDGSRVGMYGGSYGGYMTAMALVKEPDVFQVGVAASSVTDWRNYDTIYTERYMRTPEENPEGYDLGSTLPYAHQLTGRLLLAHGSIDNNVNPGNTMQLINALVEAGKRFDLMYYPENRHGYGSAAGRHFSQLRVDYLIEHLDPPAWPWTR